MNQMLCKTAIADNKYIRSHVAAIIRFHIFSGTCRLSKLSIKSNKTFNLESMLYHRNITLFILNAIEYFAQNELKGFWHYAKTKS